MSEGNWHIILQKTEKFDQTSMWDTETDSDNKYGWQSINIMVYQYSILFTQWYEESNKVNDDHEQSSSTLIISLK